MIIIYINPVLLTHVSLPHLLVDCSAVGRLHQDFDAGVGELFDVARGQRRPPLPRVDVLAADGHDGPVVLIAALGCEAALRPLTLVTEESEHDFSCSGQTHGATD